AAAAREGRTRPIASEAARNGLGRRLPVERVKRLRSVRIQLALLVVAAVCLPLAVVLSSGWVMLGMHVESKIAAVAVASALVGLAGAFLLGRRILRPLEQLRAASARLADGDLSARASESGPSELADVSAAFNEMAANIEQLFDARRELVAWASHDLRSPLASIQAMIEALEDGLADPADYLPTLRDQVRTLSRLVDDLFELARIDSGALSFKLEETRVAVVVESALRLARPDASNRKVELLAYLDAEATARVEPDKIQRVLSNLLTNALHHTPSDGSVA